MNAAAMDEDCENPPPEPVEELIELLNVLESLGITIGLALATLGYIIAGLHYIYGGPRHQQVAKTWFINTTLGLLIILLSASFVRLMTGVLGCG